MLGGKKTFHIEYKGVYSYLFEKYQAIKLVHLSSEVDKLKCSASSKRNKSNAHFERSEQ